MISGLTAMFRPSVKASPQAAQAASASESAAKSGAPTLGEIFATLLRRTPEVAQDAAPEASTEGVSEGGPSLSAQAAATLTSGAHEAAILQLRPHVGVDGSIRVTGQPEATVPPLTPSEASTAQAGPAGPKGFGRMIPVVRRLARLSVFNSGTKQHAPVAASAGSSRAASAPMLQFSASSTSPVPTVGQLSIEMASPPIEVSGPTSTRTGTNDDVIPIRTRPAAEAALPPQLEADSGSPVEVDPTLETSETGKADPVDVTRADWRSSDLLESLDPEFRTRLERVIERMESESSSHLEVIETSRTQERQADLFAQGRTRPGPVVTWTMASQHLDGRAADIQLNKTWNDPKSYALLQRIAQEEGLRTLGPRDAGHVELPSVEAKARESVATAVAESAVAPRPRPRSRIARVARVARVAAPARPGMASVRPASSAVSPAPAAVMTAPAADSSFGSPVPEAPAPIRQPVHQQSEVITETVARALPEIMERLDVSTRHTRDGQPTLTVPSSRTVNPTTQRGAVPAPTEATRPEIVHANALEATMAPVLDRPRRTRSGAGGPDSDSPTAARIEAALSLAADPGAGVDAGSTRVATPGAMPGSDGLERVQKVLELQEQAPASNRIDVRDLDGQGTRLRMRMVGNELEARLDVQDQGTLRRMRDRVEQLHRSLEGQGIQVKNLDLRAGDQRRSTPTLAAPPATGETASSGHGSDTQTRQESDERSRSEQDSQQRERSLRDEQRQNQEEK